MRTFIIGDVHGCLDELRSLVSALNPEVGDRFAFVGDIVDKGANTVGTIRYVKLLLSLYPGSVCIAGNHESKAIERYTKQGKDHPKAEPWAKEATDDDWEFLLSLPLYARFSELHVLLVHGGLFPRFFELYPGGLEDARLLGKPWHKGGGKYTKRAKRILYTRYINPETGDNLALGEEGPDTPHWADLYDGREGFVFYGHEPQHSGSPRVNDHAIGVDTAAVSGMCLTAAVLTPVEEAQTSKREWLSEKAKKVIQREFHPKFDLTYERAWATESTIEAYHQLCKLRDLENSENPVDSIEQG